MSCTKCNVSCSTCPCTCGCDNIQPTECIQYTGNTLPCLGVAQGDMINSVIKKINDAMCDSNGSNGLSAYEIAVGLGFLGTESEWIASLQGADGSNSGFSAEANEDGTITFTFPDGSTFTAPDLTGANGDSAYAIWLAEGNVGSEVDFLASLQGAQGIQGNPASNDFKVLYSNFTRVESGDSAITVTFSDDEISSIGDILTFDFNLYGNNTSTGNLTITGSANMSGYPITVKTMGGGDIDNLYHATLTFVQTGVGLTGSIVYSGLPEVIDIQNLNFSVGAPNGGDYSFIFTMNGAAGDFAIDDLVVIRKKVQ